jgi:hypothetical protein
MATVEQLEPPSPRRRFAYWGPHAALKLSEDLPAVILEYVTEPPHGDPLYKLTIGGITVGGRKRPLLFFGRDIHLSPCSRFLGITSLGRESHFHVVDLGERKLWSRPGFVQIDGVSRHDIRYRPYIPDGLNVTPGEVEKLPLSPACWTDIATSIERL